MLLGNSLRHRPKLLIYVRFRDVRWSEADCAVSVNGAERLSIPFDADQTVLQQPCIQLLAQELSFYLSQKSFFLWCEFFVHIIPPICSAIKKQKKGLIQIGG